MDGADFKCGLVLTMRIRRKISPSEENTGSKNRAFFSSNHTVQTKLRVNEPDDRYEQEADAMADHVMKNGSSHPNNQSFFKPTGDGIQRKCQHCEEEDQFVHRKEGAGGEAKANGRLDSYVSSLGSSGVPLPEGARQFFEPGFGHDFSDVRIHTDTAAAESAQSINALAYTTGNSIVFNSGQYAPDSDAGKRLMAHELTHVVQQKNFTAIQRDKAKTPPAANGDQAKLNFKNDWRNHFSYYDKFVTIGAVTFDPKQTEKIKAVKNGKNIDVIVNGDFDNDENEKERLPWIKAAIVDKFATGTDKFEKIAYDPTHATIHGISPLPAIGSYCSQNCPATAAALEQYLKTGTISKAICNTDMDGVPGYGFDISQDAFEPSVSEKDAEKKIKEKLKKHGDFVIVEGTRSAAQLAAEHITATHYFTVVNVHQQLFAIDAFGEGIVDDNLEHYLESRVGPNATYRIAKGSFTVKEVIPKQ